MHQEFNDHLRQESKTRGLILFSILAFALFVLVIIVIVKAIQGDEIKETVSLFILALLGFGTFFLAVLMLAAIRYKRFLDFLGPGIIGGFSLAVVLLEVDAIPLQTENELLRRLTSL